MKKLILICLIYMVFSIRNVSERGIKLIKEFENCKLKSYYDKVGVITIGYGFTNADKSIIGKTITKGMTISQETADKWLKAILNKKYAPLVNKFDGHYKWTQNEFDALIAFAYDSGSIILLIGNGSRSKQIIANKMPETCRAGSKIGCVRRRKAQRALFLKK